jgi:hypothetical protein
VENKKMGNRKKMGIEDYGIFQSYLLPDSSASNSRESCPSKRTGG